MPSLAWEALQNNLKDIERLLDLHKQIGGTKPGRRHQLEVLNKSAVVLITAFWEAYCEDIAAEASEHLVGNSLSADKLPLELKKQIAAELKGDKNEIGVWSIADTGWKAYLTSRLDELRKKRNWDFQTPKTANIDKLFQSALGIQNISGNWNVSPKLSVSQTQTKLDKYVSLRGSIAHRGKHSKSVTKAEVEDYLYVVERIASKTGGVVNRHVRVATGKKLW